MRLRLPRSSAATLPTVIVRNAITASICVQSAITAERARHASNAAKPAALAPADMAGPTSGAPSYYVRPCGTDSGRDLKPKPTKTRAASP